MNCIPKTDKKNCQVFNSFQLFSSGEKLLKVAGHIQNWSKMDHLVSAIFHDFQLFYLRQHAC
jgi:hypothetical protein